MRHSFPAGLLVAAASLTSAACADRPAESPASAADISRPIALTVDVSDPGRSLFHAHLVVPTHAGTLTLAYPEWIPGTHRPDGPGINVVDLHVTAGGRALPWRRDPVRMFEIAVTVPAGASSIDVDFNYVNAVGPITHQGDATSANALVLELNRVVMYPVGPAVSAIPVDAHLKLPAGWSYATALETSSDASARGGTVDFRTTSLEMLVDSPIIAGRYLRTYDLGVQRGVRHSVSVVAETAAEAEAKPEQVERWRRLTAEATALFGARHYGSYKFLVVLSNAVEGGRAGLEHHQSSLDGLPERALVDDDVGKVFSDLLPHEYAHSWDGKYRRPRGIATPDFRTPMHDELLWVYEGLTEYLGVVLAARSGLEPVEDIENDLARWANGLDTEARSWRPLVDTAVASSVLRETPERGFYRRRDQDYYIEGALIWLEADVIIRQRSGATRSLDDFCQRFFGGKDSGAMVRPYDLDEVITTLNGVTAFDWRAFFDARVYQIAPHVPLGGLTGSGHRLAFVAEEPPRLKELTSFFESDYFVYSLGFRVKDGKISDVRVGSPADVAGIVSEGTLVAVDGRKYTAQVMKDALARAKTSREPIELLVSANDRFRTVKVDWHGGDRYPALEREPGKPDLLEKIFAPRVGKLGGGK